MNISINKLDDVGISSNLIGSLYLTNGQLFSSISVNSGRYNILHLQNVVLGHFGKTGVYAGRFINQRCSLVRDSEPIRLLLIPTSPSLYMLRDICPPPGR